MHRFFFLLIPLLQSGKFLPPPVPSLSLSPPLSLLCVHYSYGHTSSVHHDELWAAQPQWCIGVRGVNSSLLRDPFNCHILLRSPTATNTISLNNLVLVGRDVLRSCLLIFAYQQAECDEKSDSHYVLYFIEEEEAKQSIRPPVDSYETWAYKWTQLSCCISSANHNFLLHRCLNLWTL